jgi:LysR family transcriptional regulator for bpeEF and oprC
MDLLQAMKVFVRVVGTNSFSRAADTLDMTRGSVTVIIQQLEAHLKTRLLQRTTRRLSLTPDGAAYYERCVRILADIEEAEHFLTTASQGPRGKLRIDMPTAVGRRLVMEGLYQFHALYPDIELMIGFGDKPVDLIQESVDCVIRVGTLPDSNMVARRIGVYQPVTVASPAYIARHGQPQTLDDLKDHNAVNFFWGRNGRLMDLTFRADGRDVVVKMTGNMAVNDTETYLESSLRGLGIIQAPRFMALPYLQSGELIELLQQWKPASMPISVVYPQNRHLSPTVRVFVDWVAELFEKNPLVSGQDD